MLISNRRKFIRKTGLFATGTIALPSILQAVPNVNSSKKEISEINLMKLKNPLAIAMWDYSWILRHHKYGEFEDWNKVLNELAERGYNAIRIDVMPQFIASNGSGKIEHEFRSIKDGWKPSLWGNDYTMSLNPREALLEFLPKCKKYGIPIALLLQ